MINQVCPVFNILEFQQYFFHSGPKAKKLKGDASTGSGSANNNGSKAKGKQAVGSDDDEEDDDDDDEESVSC